MTYQNTIPSNNLGLDSLIIIAFTGFVIIGCQTVQGGCTCMISNYQNDLKADGTTPPIKN